MRLAHTKNKNLVIIFIIITTLLFPLFSENSKAERFLLENGIELELIKDNKNPIASIQIEIGSGFSATEKNEAGFFEILSRLFWLDTDTTLSFFNTKSEVFAHTSLFSVSFPAHSLQDSLKNIEYRCTNTAFNQSIVSQIQKDYVEEQKAVLTNPYGLIHGTIMQHIYEKNPWAQSADMSYFYFTEKSIGKLALDLKNFKERYYQPENIKLSITSPYEPNLVYSLAQQSFEGWKNSGEGVFKRKTILPEQEKKELVLVSDGFPEDLEQIIFIRSLDTSNETKEKATYIAFLLEENIDNSKTKFCESPLLSLENEQYLEFSFEQGVDSSRFISQYISKKNNTSIFEKIDEILRIEKEVEYSSDTIEPYVFVLLHPKSYAAYKANFDTNNWVYITEKDFQKSIQEKLLQKDEVQEIALEIPNYKYLFENEKNQNINLKLSNGIPVFLHIDSDSRITQIDFTIQNAMQNYTDKSFLLDEIIFRGLENTYNQISYEKMLSKEREMPSFYRTSTKNETRFSIRAKTEDIESAVYDFISLFTFFTISPLEADFLNMQIQNEERIQNASLDRQLYLGAIKELFDTKKSPILLYDKTSSIKYEDIQKRLSALYNAHAISLSFMGKEDTLASLFNICEKTLVFLKKRDAIQKFSFDYAISSKDKTIEVSHLFTSNIDAKDAGPRPVKLIPTTEFFDPLHLYFEKPKNEDEAFFEVIIYAISTILNNTNTKKSFETLHYIKDDTIDGLARFEFSEVKSLSDIKNMYKNALTLFPEWIEDENNLKFLKNTWIIHQFSNIDQKSIPEQIRLQENLISIETASASDFINFFYNLEEKEILWIISKDTKK